MRIQQAAFLHGAQQHHGTGGSQGEAEDDALHGGPAHRPGQCPAQQGGDRDLYHRARNGDGLHRHQVFQREMQAHAEHQQHHADFSQLVGQFLVSHETGGEGTHADASDQIADQGRQPQFVGQHAEHEGQTKSDGDDIDQVGVMVHSVSASVI